MGPDPYRDWLAIETDHETPNHYELLGLDLFSGDTAAVRQTYEDRYALVRRYEAGNYSDRALALMAELSDAFKCLTNESQKSRYDAELREALAARETRTDVGVLHNTLIEQISELEVIVDSDLQDLDPLGGDLASMSVLPTSSYFCPSAPGLPKAAPAKNEFAVPVWLAVLCTCGAGLLVIGAVVFAISLLGSRGNQDSTAQAPAAPNAAGDRAEGSESVPGSAVSADAGNASQKVEWSGRMARVLVDDGDTLHLLVASSDRLFEARSTDRNFIQQLADYVCLAEDAELGDDVKVVGTVVDKAASFFDPERRLRDDRGELAVLELQSLELVEATGSGDTELTAEEMETLLSLRSVGQYTQFVAMASSSFDSTSPRFQVTFHGRDYLVELPAAWRALGVEISQGQQITVVSRTTGSYASPAGGSGGINDMLLLEVETIDQPSFQQVVQSPSQFIDRTLTYQATLRSTMVKDNSATLGLEVQNAGRQFSIKGLAEIESGQGALLETMNGSDPLLVELKVATANSPAAYEVVSLTSLNDATHRVVFDAIADSKPEPMPLAASSASKSTLASLPDYVDLPPLTSQLSEPLTPAISVAELDIQFASALIFLDSAYGFVAKKVDSSQMLQWDIYLRKTLDAGTQEALVAHLAVDDSGLAFRWNEGAGKLPVGQLRNCFMQLTSGSESHVIALRSPVRPGTTSLPAGEDKFQIKFALDDPPSPESLRLDVDVSYDGTRLEANSRTNTTTRGKRLDFKVASLQDVEIQIALLFQQDNSLVLQALPRHQLSANRQIALSTQEVNDLAQRLQQSGIKADRDLAKAQRTLQEANNALSFASNSATRAKCAATVATQTKAVAANQKRIWEIQQEFDSVSNLSALVDEVHANTLIRYRIYAEKDEARLLLVDGEYLE